MKARKIFWLVMLVALAGAAFMAASCSLFAVENDDDDDDDDEESSDLNPNEPMNALDCQISIDSSNAPALTASLMCGDQNFNGITPVQAKVKLYESANGADWSEIVTFSWEVTRDSGKGMNIATSMDYSNSMSGILDDLVESVQVFFETFLSGDTGEIVKFSKKTEVVQRFTGDVDLLKNAAEDDWQWAYDTTSLYDSVLQIGNDAAAESMPRAGIAYTDGGENSSSFVLNLDSLISHLKMLGVPIFTIGMDGGDFSVDTKADLKRIANETGGFYYFAPSEIELQIIYLQMATILGASVNIGWDSSFTEEGAEVHIKIEVTFESEEGETFEAEDETTYQNPTTPPADLTACEQAAWTLVNGCGIYMNDREGSTIGFDEFVQWCEEVNTELELTDAISAGFQCLIDKTQDYCDLLGMYDDCLHPEKPGDGGCGDTAAQLASCGIRWGMGSDSNFFYPPLDLIDNCENMTWNDWDCLQDCADQYCPGEDNDVEGAVGCISGC